MIDCRDSYELAQWWKRVLGYVDLVEDPHLPGDEDCLIRDPESGHLLSFIQVPEAKQLENRLHLDFRPRSGTRHEELHRLLALGAIKLSDLRGEHGPRTGWVVLADPEGNEVCVLRSHEERASQAR